MKRVALLLVLVAASSASLLAQRDLTGMWRPLPRDGDGSGMDGDYAGLPLSPAGRMRAQSWSPQNFDVPEWVCRPHAWDYSIGYGNATMRLQNMVDDPTQRILAIQGRLWMREQSTTIRLDAPPRPAASARHTWSGFVTGEWEGSELVTTVTHLKESYIRRWGPMRSDKATVRIRYKRLGTDYLRATLITYDPVYMAEPYIRTAIIWRLDPDLAMTTYPCDEATETVIERGTVPHYLPGKSMLPAQDPKQADRFGTPYEARLGGPETMYPEYIKKLSLAGSTARVSSQPARGHDGQPQADWSWMPAIPAPNDSEVQVVPVRGKVYMLTGAGGNITVQAGDDGVVMVDTGVASMSAKVLAAVRAISRSPIRYIVNTDEREAFTGANEAIAAAGSTIPFRGPDDVRVSDGRLGKDRANVISYFTVFNRMSAPTGQVASRPEGAWPDDTYSTSNKKLHLNGEPIMITHFPANTDGNSVVHFRTADVISVGDVVDLTSYPFVDVKAGGSIQAVFDSLNRLLDITIPERGAEGGTLVIPGHGRLADQADVAYYREMVGIIRDRVQDLIKRGMTLEQVKAAKPTLDYDARYGRATGDWTTGQFVEAVYQSLNK